MPKSKKQSEKSVKPAKAKPQPEKSMDAPTWIGFDVKDSGGDSWHVDCHVQSSEGDNIILEVTADPENEELAPDGLCGEGYFDRDDFDDKPDQKAREKFIIEQMDTALDIARVGSLFDGNVAGYNALADKVHQWAIRLITESFDLPKR